VSEQAFFWIAGIGAVIIGAIAGAFWKHVVEDSKVRERVASLETDNTTTKREVASLRERFHNFRDETLKDVWKIFQEWKESITEQINKRRR
jgi:hypothetical protein